MISPRSRARAPESPAPRHDYGALEQRVYGTEQMIRDLGLQTSSQIQKMTDTFTSAINTLNAKIDSQQTAALQNSTTKFTPIVSVSIAALMAFVAVFSVIGTLALNPMAKDIAELSHSMLPRHEHELAISEVERRMAKVEDGVAGAATRNSTLRALDSLRADIRTIQNDMVTRSEHKTHWDEIAERQTALSNRLNELQHEFGSNFTMGDQLKSLQKQIDDMRMAAINASRSTAHPAP